MSGAPLSVTRALFEKRQPDRHRLSQVVENTDEDQRPYLGTCASCKLVQLKTNKHIVRPAHTTAGYFIIHAKIF